MPRTSNRIEQLQGLMKAQHIDLLALGPGAHMQWLLGFHPHADERPWLVCISQTSAAFLMPALNAAGSRQATNLTFFEWSDAEGPQVAFTELLADLGVTNARQIALDETMRADFAALVQDALPAAERQFTASSIGHLRMRKDESEFKLLKENALIADAAMMAGWDAMKVGMSELEVAEIIREKFIDLDTMPLFTIVGAGQNGAFPHHQTGETILKAGDAVVMDIGGGKSGYSSDMTRMAVLNEAPDGYHEVHAIVEAAVQAAMLAARPGVKAHVVDDAARKVITDAGYGQYFVHRTGHGMGVEIHEQPYLTSVSQTVLETGMVFSIEPGIYLPGRFGIRLEDIVILREDGPEILSDLPRDLTVI